jgi:hypothetical protein
MMEEHGEWVKEFFVNKKSEKMEHEWNEWGESHE